MIQRFPIGSLNSRDFGIEQNRCCGHVWRGTWAETFYIGLGTGLGGKLIFSFPSNLSALNVCQLLKVFPQNQVPDQYIP